MDMIRMAGGAAAVLLLTGCVGLGYASGGGYGSHGGHGDPGRYPSGGHYGGGPGYGGPGYGGPGYGGPGSMVRCESQDERSRRCAADTRGGVSISRQLSRTNCVRGRNWGWDNAGIWVSGGCRAEFVTGRGGHRPGRPDQGAGYGQTIRCESDKRRQRRCNVPVGHGVELVRQLSDTRCVRGRNWGWDRGGIWVDGGCRAEFRVR